MNDDSDGRWAYIIQVDIDASKMQEHKVSDRVRALDRVRVADKGVEEPGILGLNEVQTKLIGPQLHISVISPRSNLSV